MLQPMMNTYMDTRGLNADNPAFSDVIVKGIAPGGGLFVPRDIPHLTLDDLKALAPLSYPQRAAAIYKAFGVDFPDQQIEELMAGAYADNFDDPAIAPIKEVKPGLHVLELWHGPTSAFKDMALQCLPRFFSAAVEKQAAEQGSAHDYLILVATSGDTGKAALAGFADRPHTKIAVFYPHGGVSDIQRLQMATQRGDNVMVFAARGNFDDCQTSVKRTFNDEKYNAQLAARHELRLSSANSISWGRLMPQIVYYVSSYVTMAGRGDIVFGDPIDVCVPTGNFGNILGAWYARTMGTPIEHLLCASNENRVLTDFLTTGTYDINDRQFVLTPSPSMDILVSSNVERQLFELTDRDGSRIAEWMRQLRENRRFTLDPETFSRIQEVYRADSVDNATCLATIREVYEETGYLLDPHSAVAFKVAERLKGDNPVLVASTAHWAKFGANVFRALHGIAPDAALPDKVAQLSGIELDRRIAEKAGSYVPAGLDELDALPERFNQVIDGSLDGVEGALDSWLG